MEFQIWEFYLVTGFETEEDMHEAYNLAAKNLNAHTTLDYESTVPVLAGVAFSGDYDGANVFPPNIEVRKSQNLLNYMRNACNNIEIIWSDIVQTSIPCFPKK